MNAADPQEWLNDAEAHLAAAQLLLRGETEALTAIVAFHAHECATRALKAVLAADDFDARQIHDLLTLRRHLPFVGGLPSDQALRNISETVILWDRSANLPYVTGSEAAAAVKTAQAVLAAASSGLVSLAALRDVLGLGG